MKCIWLGIKDYCKDCWHDWLIHRVKHYYFLVEAKDRLRGDWYPLHDWKEGNLWHYIQQRRFAHKKHFADASKKIKKRK